MNNYIQEIFNSKDELKKIVIISKYKNNLEKIHDFLKLYHTFECYLINGEVVDDLRDKQIENFNESFNEMNDRISKILFISSRVNIKKKLIGVNSLFFFEVIINYLS